MLKLSSALSGWTPQGDAAHEDPLTLVGAAWSDIVGAEVAANSHPARILDGALHVTTRSSAWSQQLSFLGEHVVAAVRARLPRAGVERLRFRVGQLPVRTETGARERRPSAARRHVAERPAAQTAAEAVARFREDVDERRRAKRARGWKECLGCEALIAPGVGVLCVSCTNARAQDRAATAARLLFEAPWLGYAGTAALVEGLNEAEYDRIRTQLLARWWEALARARAAKRLSRDGHERLIASSYVVLRSKLPPEEIVPATLRSVLGDELHDLIYGTEQRRETNVE